MIAPNNELPAECFIMVHSDDEGTWHKCKLAIERLYSEVRYAEIEGKVIAIFRIRLNKLPTKHKFK